MEARKAELLRRLADKEGIDLQQVSIASLVAFVWPALAQGGPAEPVTPPPVATVGPAT